jgi:tRNA(Ile)-lysidine synthase
VARARAGAGKFSPAWLRQQLSQLLPEFPGAAMCVAFSGGADSTALLAAVAALKPAQLRAIYVDHQLHADSARWGRHCRKVALSLGVRLQVRRVRVARGRGASLEATARAARYAALGAALRPGEALLTAHHEDDQLETVLLQLLRGAGVAGLAAMPACAPLGRGLLVRPLIGVPRAQLRAWARTQALKWVEDASNADERLDRNYLRARVLPAILGRWPAAPATVVRGARHTAEAQRLLESLGAADVARASHGAMLSAAVLRALPPARRRNALRLWITRAGHLAPSARRLEEIAGPLLSARADAHPQVAWDGTMVQRQADLLAIRARPAAPARVRRAPAVPPRGDGAIRWQWRRARRRALASGCGTLALRQDARGPLDLDALAATLLVRTRRGGERLHPVRGGSRRTLKSLLQEARVPLEERARLPLVYAGARLVAVADRWLDASVQASAASRHRARLVWSREVC